MSYTGIIVGAAPPNPAADGWAPDAEGETGGLVSDGIAEGTGGGERDEPMGAALEGCIGAAAGRDEPMGVGMDCGRCAIGAGGCTAGFMVGKGRWGGKKCVCVLVKERGSRSSEVQHSQRQTFRAISDKNSLLSIFAPATGGDMMRLLAASAAAA